MELLESPRGDQCALRVHVEPSDISETNYKLEALEVIDEHKGLTEDQDEELRDNVFEGDSSETDSATESCDECGREKNTSDSDTEKSETTSHLNGLEAAECSENNSSSKPSTVRQNSDEGISAPKKSKNNDRGVIVSSFRSGRRLLVISDGDRWTIAKTTTLSQVHRLDSIM